MHVGISVFTTILQFFFVFTTTVLQLRGFSMHNSSTIDHINDLKIKKTRLHCYIIIMYYSYGTLIHTLPSRGSVSVKP